MRSGPRSCWLSGYAFAAAFVLSACGGATAEQSPLSTGTPRSEPPPQPYQAAPAPSPTPASAMVLTPPADTDADGLADDGDRCPDDPEDFDAFEDDDGCPDPDNDRDGITDVNDRCPNLAETFNGVADEDGCPENDPPAGTRPAPSAVAGLAVLGPRSIELREPLAFNTGTATIASASLPLLDEVAAILVRQPSIRVEVGAHTDSAGSSAHNMKLSQARADAVVAYLVGKGIRSTRLRAIGYGETKPIADNATPAGRAANRRIELVVSR